MSYESSSLMIARYILFVVLASLLFMAAQFAIGLYVRRRRTMSGETAVTLPADGAAVSREAWRWMIATGVVFALLTVMCVYIFDPREKSSVQSAPTEAASQTDDAAAR